jgi:hypothetical protein
MTTLALTKDINSNSHSNINQQQQTQQQLMMQTLGTLSYTQSGNS